MRVGISTACLYPRYLEEALSELISMKFRLFEIFFNTFSELEPCYVKRLACMVQQCGGKVRSIHPFTSGFEGFLFFTDYDRRYWDGVELYKRYFETANQVGAGIFVLHGQRDYQNSGLTEEEYFDRYAKLYRVGKEHGITVAQENVNRYRSEDPGFILRMREFLGDQCAFVLDIKQAVRAGYDPFNMCAAMGNRLLHVHINDNLPGRDCLLPGQGTMDYKRLLSMLGSFGYSGDLIVEVYRKNFVESAELTQAVDTVKIMLNSL